MSVVMFCSIVILISFALVGIEWLSYEWTNSSRCCWSYRMTDLVIKELKGVRLVVNDDLPEGTMIVSRDLEDKIRNSSYPKREEMV